MADHNGDFSPEAERKRQLKREKMQRRRIRARIEEGRATASEIAAIEAWERGEDWVFIRETGERLPAAAQDRPGEEEIPVAGWGLGAWAWVAGVAVFIGFCVWSGVRNAA